MVIREFVNLSVDGAGPGLQKS